MAEKNGSGKASLPLAPLLRAVPCLCCGWEQRGRGGREVKAALISAHRCSRTGRAAGAEVNALIISNRKKPRQSFKNLLAQLSSLAPPGHTFSGLLSAADTAVSSRCSWADWTFRASAGSRILKQCEGAGWISFPSEPPPTYLGRATSSTSPSHTERALGRLRGAHSAGFICCLIFFSGLFWHLLGKFPRRWGRFVPAAPFPCHFCH